jgi:hypothetical protein
MGIRLIVAPVESHSSIGIVERFHAPIRHVFQKMQQGPDKDSTQELRLELPTKAVNDTIGIHGYVPTILVYGALPSTVLGDACSHSLQHQRMRMLRIARAAAEAHTAERRIREAEKHMSPSGEYELSPGDPVLIWWENEGWTGPFTFLDRIGGTAVVNIGKERRSIPKTKVKP